MARGKLSMQGHRHFSVINPSLSPNPLLAVWGLPSVRRQTNGSLDGVNNHVTAWTNLMLRLQESKCPIHPSMEAVLFLESLMPSFKTYKDISTSLRPPRTQTSQLATA